MFLFHSLKGFLLVEAADRLYYNSLVLRVEALNGSVNRGTDFQSIGHLVVASDPNKLDLVLA